jgi:hypothetical protein
MYGMIRTTIYLPDALKAELARAAAEEGRTEADLIREGVEPPPVSERRAAAPPLPERPR